MAKEGERRRAERFGVNAPGELCLSEGRHMAVRILNLGVLGALVQVHDLEEAVFEGERALLVHPVLEEGQTTDQLARSPGGVVRVQLEFAASGVSRLLAIHFDGGAAPQGC